MAGIRFVPSESIRFYNSAERVFYDTNYIFNRLDEDADSLEKYNNFYLAIPAIQREDDLMEDIWQSNFISKKYEVVYHVMMKFKEWGSFVYKYKAVAPTTTDGYLTDTDPNSTYFERKFLLLKLNTLCGRLFDGIEYQFSVYATYLDMNTGITHSTRENCDDIVSKFVAINKPTTPYIYDHVYEDNSWLKLQVSLSKSVSFANPGVSRYELLCFTDTLQLNGNDPTLIRAETIELMGEVRTFDNIDPEATSTDIYIAMLDGTAAASTTFYVNKNVLKEKNANCIYFGVRLDNDAYGNSTDPDYSTYVTRDWFRIDLDTEISTTIQYNSFSSNFSTDIISTDILGYSEEYYAINSGNDNPLIVDITGEFSEDCRFFLDLGIFTRMIEIPYDHELKQFGTINLSDYSKYFVPKVINQGYHGVAAQSGYSVIGRRENAELVIIGDYGTKRIDIGSELYGSVNANSITHIYDYDLLKDLSLFMNSDTSPDCIVFREEDDKKMLGRFVIKNPFYYYEQYNATGNMNYMEYISNNSIIKNEEIYAKILYNSNLIVSGDTFEGTIECTLSKDADNYSFDDFYGGFMVSNANIPYIIGENNYTLKIVANDTKNTVLVEIPFFYVATEATENVEVPTLSIRPTVGVGINHDMRNEDGYVGMIVNGDVVINGAIYKAGGTNAKSNIMNLPFPETNVGIAAVSTADILCASHRTHEFILSDQLKSDMGTTANTLEFEIKECKVYIEYFGSTSFSTLVDIVYVTTNGTYESLRRYVGKYTRTAYETVSKPLFNYPLKYINQEGGTPDGDWI